MTCNLFSRDTCISVLESQVAEQQVPVDAECQRHKWERLLAWLDDQRPPFGLPRSGHPQTEQLAAEQLAAEQAALVQFYSNKYSFSGDTLCSPSDLIDLRSNATSGFYAGVETHTRVSPFETRHLPIRSPTLIVRGSPTATSSAYTTSASSSSIGSSEDNHSTPSITFSDQRWQTISCRPVSNATRGRAWSAPL
jgi:hypothetical protein